MNKPHTNAINLLPKLLLALIILLCLNSIHAQVWMEPTPGKDPNFYTIQKKFNKYWKAKEAKEEKLKEKNKQQDKIKKEEGEEENGGLNIYKRWENYWSQRISPDGTFPPAGVNIDAFNEYLDSKGIKNKGQKSSMMTGNWTSLGPNSSPGGYPGIGRVNSIGFDPSNSSIIYLGAAGGGLWKTTNGGTSWTTPTDGIATLGVSGIVVLPSTPTTIYIATGDGDAGDNYSVGVLKSIDGGVTWNTTGYNVASSSGTLIRKLVLDPNDENTLLIATNAGIYRTINAGATWSQVQSGNFYDLEANPNAATNIFYACTSNALYKSSDNGASWSNVQTIAGSGRLAIAVTAANSAVVYALSAKSSDYGFNGLFKSTDSGASYVSQSTTPNLLGYNANGGDAGGQGWYDLIVTVDPANENTVYTGGVNNWKSTDSGVNWTLNSFWYNLGNGTPEVHADKHAFEWNNGVLYQGTDGGIYKTSNGGTSWPYISGNIVISEMYRLGVSKADTKVIAGLQDNGTKLRSTGGVWSDVIGGDGFECAINPVTPNTMYGEIYYGDIYRSTDGGVNFNEIITGLSGNAAWVTPFQLDPVTPTTLYIGYSKVFKTTNQGTNWSAISPDFGLGVLTTINVAPSNPLYIYAGNGSNLRRTVDGGTNWVNMTMPGSGTSMLVVHPTNPDILWAVRQNYTAGAKVYKSINGGASWTNISGTLPNIPANCIAYAKCTQDGLYVGMDVGVYYRDNTLADWVLHSTGLPNVEISELEVKESENAIYAATYGRGLWKSDLYASTPLISITQGAVVNPTCGASNGSITLNFTNVPDGVYTISYVKDGNPGSSSQTVTANTTTIIGLGAGNYTLFSITSSGCTGSLAGPIVLTNIAAPVINSVVVTQPSCALPTGTIVINATGGGTLEYTVNNGANWFTTSSFPGLSPGNYNVVVRLQATPSCSTSYVMNPIVLNTPVGCGGGCPPLTSITVNPATICAGSTSTLTANGALPGAIINWYDMMVGGMQVGTGNPFTTPVLNTTTTYYAEEVNGALPTTQTFNYTGAVQTFTVPAGVTSITINAYGAAGGSGNTGNSSGGPTLGGVGGNGSKASGTLTVVPGQVLNIYVGGQGSAPTAGYNGGGTAGSQNAGGGGGASDMRYPGTGSTDRIIVAGGGGGGGRGGCESNNMINGGAGGTGDGNGANGVDAPTSGGNAGGGFGAIGSNAGGAGIGCGGFLGQPGQAGDAFGVGGMGGGGQSCCCFSFGSIPGGGGGGGGYLGGGGGGGGSAGTTGCSGNDKGAGGGGAGGTSYIGGVTSGSTMVGVQTGDGQVTITYGGMCTSTRLGGTVNVNPVPQVDAVANQIYCVGSSVPSVVFTSPTPGATFNWTRTTEAIGAIANSGVGNVPTFTATNSGTGPLTATFTVTASYTSGGVICTGAAKQFTITINPNPTVNAVSNQAYCIGSTVPSVVFTSPNTGGTIVYNWTRTAGAIGLAPLSGTGPVPSFVATNAGTTPLSSTFTVNATYTNGGVPCSGPSITFTITVNPTPQVNPVANIVTCANSLTGPINFSSTVAGTTFSWTNNNATIGLGASGTGNIPQFTAINNGTTTIVATITVIPTFINGGVTCTGTPISFTITISPAPIAMCKNATIFLNSSGTATLQTSDINNGSTGGTISISKTTFNCSNIGANTVILTVTDVCGKTATCSAIVTVVDNLPPVINGVVAPIVNIQCDQSVPAAPTVTATDNCSAVLTYTETSTQSKWLQLCEHYQYQITRLWVATDPSGNSTSKVQVVNVIDNKPPVMTMPPVDNLYANCDESEAHGCPIPIDNCDQTPSLLFEFHYEPYLGLDGCTNSYTVVRKWTAGDKCGNTTVVYQHVYVVDKEKPELTCPANIEKTSDKPVAVSWIAPKAHDNCDGALTATQIAGPKNGSNFDPGTTTKITYVTVDNCGNTDTCSFLITINKGSSTNTGAKISGALKNMTGGLIENAEVDINGDVNQFVNSASGSYEFTGIAKGSTEDVSVSKLTNPLEGVNTLDLVFITNHILGKKALNSPYKILAADVNNSGNITTADLVELRKLILHITDKFANVNSWEFLPSTITFSNPFNPWKDPIVSTTHIENIQTDQVADFSGIKMGDVTWDALGKANANIEVRTNEVYSLVAENKPYKKGEEVELAVSAKELGGMKGMQFTLEYDPASLEYVGIKGLRDDVSEENFGMRYMESGKITGSIDFKTEVTEEPLFRMRFRAIEAGELSRSVKISSGVTTAEAYTQNDETIGLNLAYTQNGKLIEDTKAILYQNEPNPFENSTVIRFYIPESQEAILSIYTLDGKLIKEIKGSYTRGDHNVNMAKDEFPGSGIYYYQLKTNNYSDIKKMMFIK